MSRWLHAWVLIFLGIAALSTCPAQATFPGRNGPIVMLSGEDSRTFSYQGAILKVGANGGPVRRRPVCSGTVREGHCAVLTDLAGSPDGRRIALSGTESFRAPDGFWSSQPLVLSLIVGGDLEYTMTLPTQIRSRYDRPGLRWFADGRRLLLFEDTGEASVAPDVGLTTIEAGSDLGQPVTDSAEHPDISLRDEIAYTHADDLYVWRFGRHTRRLTWQGGNHPSWSPQGRWIAFTRSCVGRDLYVLPACVYKVRAGGGKPRLLARGGSEPVWSPDGKRIAFLRVDRTDDVSGKALFSVSASGGRARRLTGRLDNIDANHGVSGIDWLVRP